MQNQIISKIARSFLCHTNISESELFEAQESLGSEGLIYIRGFSFQIIVMDMALENSVIQVFQGFA